MPGRNRLNRGRRNGNVQGGGGSGGDREGNNNTWNDGQDDGGDAGHTSNPPPQGAGNPDRLQSNNAGSRPQWDDTSPSPVDHPSYYSAKQQEEIVREFEGKNGSSSENGAALGHGSQSCNNIKGQLGTSGRTWKTSRLSSSIIPDNKFA